MLAESGSGKLLTATAAVCGLFLMSAVRAADVAEDPLPKVMIIATGGTIAGVQDDPEDPSRYRAGSLSAEDIVASVPEIGADARVETLQFSNVPSPEIVPEDWVRLSNTVTELLAEREDIVGAVITHGTDRLEETAFFLHLTVRSQKPVVIVGAQRPATNASADGPANLLAAVRTAAAPQSRGRGVLVVMDERIMSAREVRKDYPRVGGFAAGRIGVVGADGPYYLYTPSRPHTSETGFSLSPNTELPRVDLVFSYSGGRGPRYDDPPAGIVVAATNASCEETLALQVLARKGATVVMAFPTGESVRQARPDGDSERQRLQDSCTALEGDPRWDGAWVPPIPAQLLTPQKARILLMLALGRTRENAALLDMFLRY